MSLKRRPGDDDRAATLRSRGRRCGSRLTPDDSEFDAVRAWDFEDAGLYDGTRAPAKTERHDGDGGLFENERNALSPAIPTPLSDANTRPIADDDASRERRARREAMARCVHEGEVSC